MMTYDQFFQQATHNGIRDGLSCRLVSTQLIEAGEDVD